ncbi:MAG TPA: NUDIX hydrolase [Pseudomonadales bacterium]|nr:NUDIX hydrolase [Pseudomonadales bacterium]
MPEIDPAPVAVRSAATLLLVDDRPNLQVFMMKRNANVQFAGGMWVFPGGSVDDGDNAANYQKYCTHRSDSAASEQLGIARGGLAFYVAAIREAFEEAGIVLALHRESGAPLELIDVEIRQRFDALRDGVNDGSVDFLQVVEQENLILDAGQIHYVARWITPPGPPRRFDTRFFVSRMPDSQNPIHDDSELVNSGWLSPQEVIERVAAKEMGMLPPTLRMVEALAAFDSAADVMAAAGANLPDERVPMAGKDIPAGPISKAEPGWVRLRPLK